MRSKKALKNIIVSLLLQIITIICGLIVPRLIIGTFGSNINGIVTSITQFLSYIVLLEAGVGGVVRSALYQPLAKRDINKINGILRATEKFFRTIALIFVAYLIIVALIYPYIIDEGVSYLFVFSLVLIIGISSFVQYYFGITYQILLRADQKLYVITFLQIVTLIFNTLLIVILINYGASIHVIQLVSASVYVLRPLIINSYVKRKYTIIKNYPPNNDAIKQKWDGLGHHIAYFLHRNTDIVVLTIFTNVIMVSVYSVYYMVVSGIQRLINSFSAGLESTFGNILAKGESEALARSFRAYGFISFTITTVLFSSAAILIIPFITLYTNGIDDANYIRPMFAYVLIIAEAIYCIRLPYHSVILAAGHFKQTKKAAYLEAIINIILSIILVNILGITGVALATLLAMLTRTIYYAKYFSDNFIEGSLKEFFTRLLISVFVVGLIVGIVKIIPIDLDHINSYTNWFIYAMFITCISATITIFVNIVFFYRDFKNILSVFKRFIQKNK